MGTLVSPLLFAAQSPASPIPPSTPTTARPSKFVPSPSGRQSNPLFLRVPIDLIFSILDHLDAPTIISLALACKDLYAICASNHAWDLVRRPPPGDTASPNRPTRAAFLALLMKDLPSPMLNCTSCSTLHHPRLSWPGAAAGLPAPIIGYRCAAVPSAYRLAFPSTAPTSAPAPTSSTQHLLSTTHLLAPAPALNLNLQVNYDAKLSGSTLHVKRTHGLRAHALSPQQWSSVISGLREARLPLCPHTKLPNRCFVPALEIPHVRRGGCSACHTEFQTVSIGQQSKVAEGQFFLESYYALGKGVRVDGAAQWDFTGLGEKELGPTEAWEGEGRKGCFHPVPEGEVEVRVVEGLEGAVGIVENIWKGME